MDNVEKEEASTPEEVSEPEAQISEDGSPEHIEKPKGKPVFKASKRQLELSNIIKTLHDDLRESARIVGAEQAWEKHLKNEKALQEYADAMKELAEIWEKNAKDITSRSRSRVRWTVVVCYSYFFKNCYLKKREPEERISLLAESSRIPKERFLPDKIPLKLKSLKILDVGSCFNPYKSFNAFDVTAIDLCPVDETVYRGDFLKVELESDLRVNGQDIEALPKDYFHCVIFSLFLEYMPSSEQRIKCCRKAYDLLKFEGILVIVTPDSQHVGKNAKLMKNWRYTLGKIGFARVIFEKLRHVTCLVFRKCLVPEAAYRWSDIYFEPGMTLTLDIPQDKEPEIVTCLDISQDTEIEETVSSHTSLCGKESQRKPSLDTPEQPGVVTTLAIPLNMESSNSPSRISWTVSICDQYFSQQLYLKHRENEENIVSEYNCAPLPKDRYLPLNIEKKTLLDMSTPRCELDFIAFQGPFPSPHPNLKQDIICGPSEAHSTFEVTDYKMYLDFPTAKFEHDFHCVVLNNHLLLWSYGSSIRMDCCQKAYDYLKFEGILVITSMESTQVGNNTHLTKLWTHTLGQIGFALIKFEKLRNIVCLVFRKCLSVEVARNCKPAELTQYQYP